MVMQYDLLSQHVNNHGVMINFTHCFSPQAYVCQRLHTVHGFHLMGPGIILNLVCLAKWIP